jgi:branched-chain amino acid aminotransferase
MALPKFAFFNGQIVPYSEAKVGVLTHTFNYGTGVFGGVRGYWNEEDQELYLFRPHDHFRRFVESTKLLLIDHPYSEDQLCQIVVDLLRAEDLRTDCYIRPIGYFSDEAIGVKLHNLRPQVAIVAIPFGSYVPNEESLHATVSSWRRVDDNSIPARGKICGSYVNSAFAKTDALRAGFDEAIVLNQDGHISEGSAENIFLIRKGVAYTPPITENILEGIVRRTDIQLLRDDLGITVVERPIDRTEIYLADEAFFCGTGVQLDRSAPAGWVPSRLNCVRCFSTLSAAMWRSTSNGAPRSTTQNPPSAKKKRDSPHQILLRGLSPLSRPHAQP